MDDQVAEILRYWHKVPFPLCLIFFSISAEANSTNFTTLISGNGGMNVFIRSPALCKGWLVLSCRSGLHRAFSSSAPCKPGCLNGFCTLPNECICTGNWAGDLCNTCLPGWTGSTCDTRLSLSLP